MLPEELANTAWASAAEGTPHLGEFNPQDLANSARAFAIARHLDEVQDLANSAWAFATEG